MNLAGLGNFRQFVEPGIRHRDLADIGLDGAERIISPPAPPRLGQRIEQRRFADIGQPDDTAFESMSSSTIFSSSWPACPGHPRLVFVLARKTWIAGSSPAMTS